MLNGIDERLTNLEIGQRILVRVVLADVRAQAPQMLQAEMLEVMVVIVMTRMVPRRILRERLKGLNPREGYSP